MNGIEGFILGVLIGVAIMLIVIGVTMIFRKKEKPIERYWEDGLYMEIKSIKQQVLLNESQHRLGLIDPSEYKKTHDAIDQRIRQLESKMAFDGMMGNPMDSLERLFND